MANRAKDLSEAGSIARCLIVYATQNPDNRFPAGPSSVGDPGEVWLKLITAPVDPMPLELLLSPVAPSSQLMTGPRPARAQDFMDNDSFGLLNCDATIDAGGAATGRGNREYAPNARAEAPLVCSRAYPQNGSRVSDWNHQIWNGHVAWNDTHVSWHLWPGVTTVMSGKRRSVTTDANGAFHGGDDLWTDPDGVQPSTPTPDGGAVFGIAGYGWNVGPDGWLP